MSQPRPRRARAGLTLLEAAVLFAVIGGAMAAFLPVFFREIRTSKTAEAAMNLEILHRRAAAYYAASHMSEEGRLVTRCLPETAGPSPANASPKPVTVDFAHPDSPGHVTFGVLGFQPDAVRFRYTLVSHRQGCDLEPLGRGPDLEVIAEGDLDGDGELSTFVRAAIIDESGALVPHGPLRTKNRIE